MTLTHDFSYDTDAAAVEDYFELGLTDGLPVIPPTVERVSQFLAVAGLAPDEVLGEVPTRRVVVTADKVAANAVMAGCRPEYFPTVLAAVRGLLSTKGNAHSTTASLAGPAHAVIVNGPVRGEIGVASGQACFGPGFRANATIGRALRLVIRNAVRSVPGELDRATFSSPLRYSLCFGEDEEASDWTPLHVQRGFDPADSVVTLQSVTRLADVVENDPTPEGILGAIVDRARSYGMGRDEWCGDDRGVVVVIGLEHRQRLVRGGWDKPAIAEYLWSRCNAPAVSRYDNRVTLAGPDNVLVVTAGGPGIPVSWLILPHLSNPISQRIAPARGGLPAGAASPVRGDRAAVAAALAEIQQTLRVDGYRLDVDGATATGLQVSITALEDACEDCLAPPDVLKMIISARLDGAYQPDAIELRLPAG
jgi:hypothetical protein